MVAAFVYQSTAKLFTAPVRSRTMGHYVFSAGARRNLFAGRPRPVSPELERDLENIRQLNRWFGSYALISMFLSGWIKPGSRLRIVDLATGSGDIPRLIAECGRKIGAELRIDALDRQSATLEIAQKLSVPYPEISFVEGNILEWRPAEPYDVVFCTLALHHVSDNDAVRVVQR